MLQFIGKLYEHFALNALTVGNYNKAAKYFKRKLAIFPDRPGANYNYAVSLMGMGKFYDAEKHLLEEIKISGEQYSILKTVGELYYTNNRREKAVTFLKKAIAVNANKKEKLFLKKKLAIAKSAEQYEKMLKGYSIFGKGTELLNKKEWEEARLLFNEAIKFDKHNPFILNNLGVISLMHDKAYGTAKEYFEKALSYTDLPSIQKNLKNTVSCIKKELADYPGN